MHYRVPPKILIYLEMPKAEKIPSKMMLENAYFTALRKKDPDTYSVEMGNSMVSWHCDSVCREEFHQLGPLLRVQKRINLFVKLACSQVGPL
jgi:hypothetical protein